MEQEEEQSQTPKKGLSVKRKSDDSLPEPTSKHRRHDGKGGSLSSSSADKTMVQAASRPNVMAKNNSHAVSKASIIHNGHSKTVEKLPHKAHEYPQRGKWNSQAQSAKQELTHKQQFQETNRSSSWHHQRRHSSYSSYKREPSADRYHFYKNMSYTARRQSTYYY